MSETAVRVQDVTELERQLDGHRSELTGFCYRMLGSAFEAEDAVQETLMRAWRALDRFEGRATLRSWLYGIATNVCFDHLSSRRRRALPMDVAAPSSGDTPPTVLLPETHWISPIDDARVLPASTDPAEIAVGRESVRIAFVAALQHLTPRQRAALILRDVLRWRASEVAALLGCSTTSVNSLVRRARAVLASTGLASSDGNRVPGDDEARSLVDRYVDAFERYDVDAIVALLRDDVVLSMPPYVLWMQGIDAVRTWFLGASPECRSGRHEPIRANGFPAVATYHPTSPDGSYEAFAIQVFELSGDRIVALHAFLEPGLFPLFGLPIDLTA
jgi:RNA polymerase sigma-70 factor, ECF subfamily